MQNVGVSIYAGECVSVMRKVGSINGAASAAVFAVSTAVTVSGTLLLLVLC